MSNLLVTQFFNLSGLSGILLRKTVVGMGWIVLEANWTGMGKNEQNPVWVPLRFSSAFHLPANTYAILTWAFKPKVRSASLWSCASCSFTIQLWFDKEKMLPLKYSLYRCQTQAKACCCWVTLVASDSVWPHRWQPTGSAVPGILQARTLEWVAISFSNAWKWKGKVKLLSRVWLLATP